jgi:hypothetical protein
MARRKDVGAIKKGWKVFLIVLLVIALIIAAVLIWQRKNIRALYKAATTDSATSAEEITALQEQTRERLAEKNVEVALPDMQQVDDLLNGRSTAEEVKEALHLPTGEVRPAPPTAETGAQETAAETEPPKTAPAEDLPTEAELISACYTELSTYEVDLVSRLGARKQEVLDQWTALPAANRTTAKKQELGLAGLQACLEIEAETDGVVREILDRYREQLKAIGADTGEMDAAWDYYCERKESIKTYYISKYM